MALARAIAAHHGHDAWSAALDRSEAFLPPTHRVYELTEFAPVAQDAMDFWRQVCSGAIQRDAVADAFEAAVHSHLDPTPDPELIAASCDWGRDLTRRLEQEYRRQAWHAFWAAQDGSPDARAWLGRSFRLHPTAKTLAYWVVAALPRNVLRGGVSMLRSLRRSRPASG